MDIKKIKKTFTRNAKSGWSGIACIASIIKYHNGGVSSYDLLRKNENIKGRISLFELRDIARNEGFETKGYKGNIDYLKELQNPVILHIQRDSGEDDFVVFYGCNANKFVIGDPGWGIIEYRKEELNDVWKSKALMTMNTSEAFCTAKEQLKIKRKQFLKLLHDQKYSLSLIIACSLFIAVVIFFLVHYMLIKVNVILSDSYQEKIIVLAFYLLLSILFISIFLKVGNSIFYRASKQLTYSLQRVISTNFISNDHDNLKFSPGVIISLTNVLFRFVNATFSLLFVIPLFISLILLAIFKISQIHLVMGSVFFAAPFLYSVVLCTRNKKITNQYNKYFDYENSKIDFVLNYYHQQRSIKLFNGEQSYIDSATRLFRFSSDVCQNLLKEKNKIGHRNILFTSLIILYWVLSIILMLDVENDINKILSVIIWGIVYCFGIYRLKTILMKIIEAMATYDIIYEKFLKSTQFYISKSDVFTDRHNASIKNIEINSLTFAYPGHPPILKSVNFEAKLGNLTVIKGKTGSGKSTLVSVLSRFLPISEGNVLVNGQSWNSIGIHEWRKNVSVITHPIKLFDLSVIENIGWGHIPFDANKVINFCRETGFDKFLQKLPDGYRTIVQSGPGLSSGEKQLIALAAALYRKPQVLILDEPTVNLDEETTCFVVNLLQKLKKEMVFVILTADKTFAELSDPGFVIHLCGS